MTVTKDWLPLTRAAILAMADDWIAVCAVFLTAWGIPGAALTELTARRDAARHFLWDDSPVPPYISI
jgi:hypothetical protein